MYYRCIPKSDLRVSVLGLGTWVFGGDAWGGSDEKECLNVVSAAIDSGINLIDTAPIYGYGRAETIVGKAVTKKRDKVLLATKCGLVWQGKRIRHDLTRRSVFQELEDSLKRLGVEYIDLYQCHWPDPQTPVEETMQALNELKKQGKIRYIGVSNFDAQLLKESLYLADIVSLQSQYSLLKRDLEKELIPFCHQHKVGILTYGVLGGGILTGNSIYF